VTFGKIHTLWGALRSHSVRNRLVVRFSDNFAQFSFQSLVEHVCRWRDVNIGWWQLVSNGAAAISETGQKSTQ